MLSLFLSLSMKSWLNLRCEKKHKKLKKHNDTIRNKMKHRCLFLTFRDEEKAKESQAQIITINEKHKPRICFYTFLHIKDLKPVADTSHQPSKASTNTKPVALPGMTHILLWTTLNVKASDNIICVFAAPQTGYFWGITGSTSYQDRKHFTTYLAVYVEDLKKVNKHPDVIRLNVLKYLIRNLALWTHFPVLYSLLKLCKPYFSWSANK